MTTRTQLEHQVAAEMARALRVKASFAWQEARKVAEPTVSLAWRMDAEVTERNADYLERLFVGPAPEGEEIAATVEDETAAREANLWDADREPTKPDAWSRIPPKAPGR